MSKYHVLEMNGATILSRVTVPMADTRTEAVAVVAHSSEKVIEHIDGGFAECLPGTEYVGRYALPDGREFLAQKVEGT